VKWLEALINQNAAKRILPMKKAMFISLSFQKYWIESCSEPDAGWRSGKVQHLRRKLGFVPGPATSPFTGTLVSPFVGVLSLMCDRSGESRYKEKSTASCDL
jgi:hypothetical protein